MTHVWLLESKDIHLFVTASDYSGAKFEFKKLLWNYIQNNPYPLFDELLEISRINLDGSQDLLNSHIEFTEDWMDNLGIAMDVYTIK